MPLYCSYTIYITGVASLKEFMAATIGYFKLDVFGYFQAKMTHR